MSGRHQARRRRTYGRRQHELRERSMRHADEPYLPYPEDRIAREHPHDTNPREAHP